MCCEFYVNRNTYKYLNEYTKECIDWRPKTAAKMSESKTSEKRFIPQVETKMDAFKDV